MTGLTAIDLTKLPVPDIIETLDYDAILQNLVDDLKNRLPDHIDFIESDPTYKLLEIAAYRELILRSRINDASRAVLLAYATGADLDNLAALFGVERQVIDPGDPDAIPPIPPTMEDDERLRLRTQLSLEGHSTAGPIGSYIFHTLAASPKIKDVSVVSPEPGKVDVAILSTEGNGMPNNDLITIVTEKLNAKDIRPLTDLVEVKSPEIINYVIDAMLHIFNGPDAEVVKQAALDATQEFVEQQHRLGNNLPLSGVYQALHQPGVARVELFSPTDDLFIDTTQAPFNTQIILDTVVSTD